MKAIVFLCWVLCLLPFAAFAEDFSVNDGREYKGVTVSRVEPDGIVIITEDGVEKLPFKLLPKDVQEAYHYNPNPTPTPVADLQPAQPQVTAARQPVQEMQSQAHAPAVSVAAPSSSPAPSQPEKNPRHSLVKCVMSTLALVLFFILAWFVGWRWIAFWSRRKKQDALVLETSRLFQNAYADFFAIWQLWNHQLNHGDNELPDHGGYEPADGSRLELLRRASAAEGAVETICVTFASTRKLGLNDIESLERFRLAFQTLRQAIIKNKAFAWNDPTHPECLAFKRVASDVSALIHR